MYMTVRTSKFLVPFALCAMGSFAFVFTGCERKPEKQEAPRHAPESYLRDETFRTNLTARREARNELEATHAKLARRMQKMIDAKRAELKTDDLEKVRVELEKDPEWKSLYARCEDAAQAIKENRRDAMRVVRERITPPHKADGPAK